jgi:hypothetical protein
LIHRALKADKLPGLVDQKDRVCATPGKQISQNGVNAIKGLFRQNEVCHVLISTGFSGACIGGKTHRNSDSGHETFAGRSPFPSSFGSSCSHGGFSGSLVTPATDNNQKAKAAPEIFASERRHRRVRKSFVSGLKIAAILCFAMRPVFH